VKFCIIAVILRDLKGGREVSVHDVIRGLGRGCEIMLRS